MPPQHSEKMPLMVKNASTVSAGDEDNFEDECGINNSKLPNGIPRIVSFSKLPLYERWRCCGSPRGMSRRSRYACALLVLAALASLIIVRELRGGGWGRGRGGGSLRPTAANDDEPRHTGPYRLVECQEGEAFLDHYDFYDGPDSLGSAGYNTYVGRERAASLGLVNVTTESSSQSRSRPASAVTSTTASMVRSAVREDGGASSEEETFVYLQSSPTPEGPRESVRLEGKRRFDRGLFILDLRHVPAGCGVWPAFWLTDEDAWPYNGEIDVVEGVNYQTSVKTALHTSRDCNMYAHVSPFVHTGSWDTATGIPNTWTGVPDYETKVDADDCWNMAPHQWANQGCVAVSDDNETLGVPLNEGGGGVFALEWDPDNGYIKSWAFGPRRAGDLPTNLVEAMASASTGRGSDDNSGGKGKLATVVPPDPKTWGLPYAYFAIGEGSGCSSDHFRNMRLIFNLAFCGTVAGNRYFTDCPAQAAVPDFRRGTDSVASCNAWIKSNPREIREEAYWKIRGVYVYERTKETTEVGNGGSSHE